MADVKLKHDDSPRQISVRDDMAGTYESQGWQRVQSAPRPAKKAAAKRASKKTAAPTPPATPAA